MSYETGNRNSYHGMENNFVNIYQRSAPGLILRAGSARSTKLCPVPDWFICICTRMS